MIILRGSDLHGTKNINKEVNNITTVRQFSKLSKSYLFLFNTRKWKNIFVRKDTFMDGKMVCPIVINDNSSFKLQHFKLTMGKAVPVPPSQEPISEILTWTFIFVENQQILKFISGVNDLLQKLKFKYFTFTPCLHFFLSLVFTAVSQ